MQRPAHQVQPVRQGSHPGLRLAAPWTCIAAVISLLISGCASLPDTRAMVRAALQRHAAEEGRQAATRDYREGGIQAGAVCALDGCGQPVPLPPDTQAAISARLKRYLASEKQVTA